MTSRDDGFRQYKTVLIGDGAVGKTSLRRNYLGENFKSSHIATIGVDFAHKWTSFDGKSIRLIIWDLAGQPTFENVRRHYYVGASGLFLVYSVINRESFDNASKWLVEAFKYMGKLPPTIIIGNKIDLRSKNGNNDSLAREDGIGFVEYFNEKLDVPCSYIETSALTGENVNEAFHDLMRMILNGEDEKSR